MAQLSLECGCVFHIIHTLKKGDLSYKYWTTNEHSSEAQSKYTVIVQQFNVDEVNIACV